MKTLIITVADEIFQRAHQKAIAEATTLPCVVEDLLSQWTRDAESANRPDSDRQRDAEFLKFLDDLSTRPLKPGPSIGRLNREELYQRGVRGRP